MKCRERTLYRYNIYHKGDRCFCSSELYCSCRRSIAGSLLGFCGQAGPIRFRARASFALLCLHRWAIVPPEPRACIRAFLDRLRLEPMLRRRQYVVRHAIHTLFWQKFGDHVCVLHLVFDKIGQRQARTEIFYIFYIHVVVITTWYVPVGCRSVMMSS